MAKLYQLEELVRPLTELKGIKGVAVASCSGQSDILYDTTIEGVDRALLSAMIASIAMIGEKLAHELDGSRVNYHLLSFGESLAVIFTGAGGLALMILVAGEHDLARLIEECRRVSREIGVLLRNKAVED